MKKNYWFRTDEISSSYWAISSQKKRKKIYPDFSKGSTAYDKVEALKKVFEENPTSWLKDNSNGLLLEEDTEEPLNAAENPPEGHYLYKTENYRKPSRLAPLEIRKNESPAVMFKGVFNEVRKDITEFVNNRDKYTRAGAFYKMGILMFGPPGNGKSTLIRQILQNHPDLKGSIQVTMNSVPEPEFLVALGELSQLKVLIFEELVDSIGDDPASPFLNFLDGYSSIDNCIIIATTNNPEKLPGNIVDRPSRFDKLYRFDYPNDEERTIVLSKILSREATREEVDLTKGMSVAYVKEAAMQSIIKEISIKEVIVNLRSRIKEVEKNFSTKKAMGFGS